MIDYFHKRNIIPKEFNDHENLARYITSKGWFSREKNRVKPRAFMPPPDLRLSVYRTYNLSEPEIWKIGLKRVIGKMREPRNLYGRADIQASKIMEKKLNINPDNVPPRHAEIIGWPELKEKQKSIAQELAAEASLNLYSS